MSTTATNGYAIRLELLKMSKEMLEQDWHAQRDALQQHWQQEVNLIQLRAGSGKAVPSLSIPASPTFKPFPTEEEIIKKAKVLNDFISAK